MQGSDQCRVCVCVGGTTHFLPSGVPGAWFGVEAAQCWWLGQTVPGEPPSSTRAGAAALGALPWAGGLCSQKPSETLPPAPQRRGEPRSGGSPHSGGRCLTVSASRKCSTVSATEAESAGCVEEGPVLLAGQASNRTGSSPVTQPCGSLCTEAACMQPGGRSWNETCGMSVDNVFNQFASSGEEKGPAVFVFCSPAPCCGDR